MYNKMYSRLFTASIIATLIAPYPTFVSAITLTTFTTTTLTRVLHQDASDSPEPCSSTSSPVSPPSSQIIQDYSTTTSSCVTTTSISCGPIFTLSPEPSPSPTSNTIGTILTSHPALPSLPLNGDSLSALGSFIQILNNIPDNILSLGDEAVTSFYTNISACLADETAAIKSAALKLAPALASLADNIGSDIATATSIFGSLTSEIPGPISTAESAVNSVVSDVTSAVAPIVTSATAVVGSLISDAVPIASSIGGDINSIIGSIPNPFALHKRSSSLFSLSRIEDIASELSDLAICLSAAAQSNPLFKVADCASEIASVAIPAARFVEVKRAVAVAGGEVKIIQTLGNATSADEVVKIGGQGVLDGLKELSGMSDLVGKCKFLLE